MYYSLIYPIKTKGIVIDEFRKKNDPRYEIVPFHLTFVFLEEFQIEEEELEKHIQNVLKDIKPFEISFEGIIKSFDNHVLLEVKVGKEKCIELHDKLYEGILEKYLKKEIEYIPHATMGNLNNQIENIGKVLEEAKGLKISFKETISQLVLVKRIERDSEIEISKIFKFNFLS